MRLHRSLLLSLLAATPPTAAQMPAARTGWHLGGGSDAVRFAHVAVSEAAPGVAAEVRPSGRPAVHLVGRAAAGSWGLDLEAGWAGGHIEVGKRRRLGPGSRRPDVSRYRLAVWHRPADRGRREPAPSSLALAPTLDLWAVDGDGRECVPARRRGSLLRVPLGAVELENRIGVGLSGNPIEAADIGEVSDLRGLRTLFVGIGLRFRI